MSTESTADKKMKLRLLKMLSSLPRHACTFREVEEFAVFVTASRTIRFPVSLVQGCERAGLVSLNDGMICLLPDGIAHLKRALYPDEPFQAQNMELREQTIDSGGITRAVTVNEAESPLLRLFTRKEKTGGTWIDEKQFRAGERLRSDFEKANLQPRVSANWEASVSSGNRGGGLNDLSDFALDARKRVENAIAEIGPELSEVVLDICCFLKGLETVERERGWPPRSAKLLLRTALSALARHYGIDMPPGVRTSGKSIRGWASPDYRPSINTN